MCFHLTSVHVHPLKHGQEVEPHRELFFILHKLVRNGGVRENIIEVGYKRPIAVVLHYMLPTVHDLVIVLLNVAEGVQRQHRRHHVLDGKHDDVKEMKVLGHLEGERLIAEQLDRYVDYSRYRTRLNTNNYLR